MRLSSLRAALLLTLPLGAFAQLDLDTSSTQSIKSTAKSIVEPLVKLYTDNLNVPGVGIPGLLPGPYYWWEAGGMFGTLIAYWHTTGDSSYNDLITEAMLFQVGPDQSYMPPNQSKSLGNDTSNVFYIYNTKQRITGNDDQSFWGFAAMTAAEYKFPNPPPDQPQWLALAQGVWNSQELRWSPDTCAGGLHWQIFSFNSGFTYKNTPSNAAFLNLGARLYAYTGNETYAEWTVKTWDWIQDMHLIGGSQYRWTIYDGVDERNNCTIVERTQWTYNYGMMINTAAVMWSMTGDEIWKTRASGIWNATQVFWRQDMILREVTCEDVAKSVTGYTCNYDQMSFKAYFIRWIAVSTKWAPWMAEMVQPYLLSTAQAVSQSCDPSDLGAVCGQRWDTGGFYNATGVGQQMSALEAIDALLIGQARGPVTAKTGGTSTGDPTAGTAGDEGTVSVPPQDQHITSADKAGAIVLTVVLIVGTLWITYWMIF